jgi:hypothetical protein
MYFQDFHDGNTGSNPVGDANLFKYLQRPLSRRGMHHGYSDCSLEMRFEGKPKSII